MLATAPARSDERWAELRVPAEVRAGTTIEIEIGEAPRGVDEFELLLSVDDGRSWPVRASRELDAGERVVRWRVPNLPASAARLRVRYARDDREIEGPASAPFRIAGNDGPQELRTFHEGNWWEGLETEAAGAVEQMDSRDAPTLSNATGSREFEAGSAGALLERPLESRAEFDRSIRFSAHVSNVVSLSDPGFLPLRE
jgi:hypothetical protein